MKNIKQTEGDAEHLMSQVLTTADNMHGRVAKVDTTVESLNEGALNDLRLHLGYIKAYSDLAKVRLQYHKYAADSN